MILLMNKVQYAEHRGVTKQAINKIKDKLVYDGATGKIDVAASDRALGEVRERIIAREEAPSGQQPGGYTPPADGGLTKARTATEIYRARLAQLEYDERVGKLLLADDVVRSMRAAGEAIAREIELFPTRAEELAAAFKQNGPTGLRTALANMSRQLLVTLTASMRHNAIAPVAAPSVAPAEPGAS
jgi:hypothetical protein